MKSLSVILLSIFSLYYVSTINFIDYQIIREIETKTIYGQRKNDIEPIILQSLNQTKNELTFKLDSKTADVEKTKVGNCVGYTKYFNKVLISKLNEKNYGNITVKHARAKVLFMGKNVHVIKSNSLKDHDISVIHNITTNKTYFVDPSLSEVFGNIILTK